MEATGLGQWLFALTGLFVVGLGWPLARGRVGRNETYGYRSRAALSDDGAWYRANRVAGRGMMLVGGILVIYAVLAAGWLTPAAFFIVGSVLFIGGALIACMAGERAARG